MNFPSIKVPFLFTLLLATLLTFHSHGQRMEQPVTWTTQWEYVEGSTYKLTFEAEIEKGWYVYSQFQDIPEDEAGPVPLLFEYNPGNHFQLLGKAREEGDPLITEFDKTFGYPMTKFYKRAHIEQLIEVRDSTLPITGYLEFQVCDDSKCLPPTPFDFSFQIAKTGDNTEALANNETPLKDTIDQSIIPIQESFLSPAGECGEAEGNVAGSSMGWIFLLGFAGGLLALLTPCVFPMIPLTVSFFTKQSRDRKTGIRNAILYGLSIIVIYVTIGLAVTAISGPTALNELSTNAFANVFFFIVFFIFALSFFGFFEITLPSSWANRSDSLADKGGILGIFFMASTLAIVSFSCTGPIIGQSLVLVSSSQLGPFTVMLGFSTALALPFALFAAFPAWLNALPKSGGWMNTVKVLLGFIELALAFKFLSVADMTSHWGILPYEAFMGIWTLIALGIALYLFGIIRFPHDSPGRRRKPAAYVAGVAALALTVYLGSGFRFNEKTQAYRTLPILSGWTPPAHYNIFLPDPTLDPELKAQYSSYSKCANNLDCFKDYEEGLSYARETGKPVLLDFTGYGCVNCRKTEEHIWIKDDIWNRIQEEYVLISLYVDDRMPLPKELISASRGVRLRNVGNKWADFQIINFQQNSQPLYVLLSPEEEVLAHPRGYHEGANQYADFLKCGLFTYESMVQQHQTFGKVDPRLQDANFPGTEK